MNILNASQIERNINQLSLSEQLWIAERIIRRLRQETLSSKNLWQRQIAEMAADAEIQNELGKIEEEFMITESDGLEKV